MKWSVGFLLDDTGRVVLIRKKRPEWQAGLLNGVGGKVEPGESPLDAMRREFREEAGVDVDEWDHLLTLGLPDGFVYVYRARVSADVVDAVYSVTDERIVVGSVSAIRAGKTVPNLRWIVPLAAHTANDYEPFTVWETSTSTRRLPRRPAAA